MSSKNLKLSITLMLLLVGLVVSAPVFAGSAVIGSVAGTMNATIGGQALLPNSTVFSGDSLQVKDGVAVVAVGRTNRMVFGRETVASFLRDSNEVTVILSQGNVSMFHPDDSTAVRVKAGDISILPARGFKTLGEVAMLNGSLVVSAKEGSLRVEGSGQSVTVNKGQTITISPRNERAPQKGAAGGGSARVSTSSALQWASVGTGGVSAVLSGVALSRAGSAKDAATSASTAADNANTAASNAATAATAASTAATAAQAGVTNLCNELTAIYPTLTCQ